MSRSISTEEELKERVKELSCLYNVSSVLAKHKNELSETLKKVAKILQKSWRFSNVAIVEIALERNTYKTEQVPKLNVFQSAAILVFNKKVGFIKVYYPSPEFSIDHFLKEEMQLLRKVASELANFYEKIKNKEKEEILRRTAQRNDRLVILGEITAGIAHELNTPLGNILGFAELIASKSDDHQIQADIQKIIQSAIYSREVVKKLMFFACEMPQNMESIQIKPVVEQVLVLLGPMFRKAEVTHKLQVQNSQISAQLDSIQLSQVLYNLLMNAIYVSPKKGKINIEVKNDMKFLYIEIADEGPGIEEDIRSKIFEPFFSTKPLGEGTGLGLSVVHGIVKSHKGNIITLDKKPRGTIFQVQLPLTH